MFAEDDVKVFEERKFYSKGLSKKRSEAAEV